MNPHRTTVQSTPSAAGGWSDSLQRIPLALRMGVYAGVFLTVMLVGLPWLAYRVDVLVPALHVELGWLRLIGVAVFIGCLGLYLFSAYQLSRHGRGAYVEFDPPREFVAVGPYRWVRNPIAACVVGMLLGEALAWSSTGIFSLFCLSLIAAHLQVVWLEEPLLRRRFGQRYQEYLTRVPRWIPRYPRGG